MTWPISTIEHGTYQWLLREVSNHVGWDANVKGLTHEQFGQVDSAVQSGVTRAYFPEPLEGEPHQWSFLTPVARLTVSAGDGVYDLPSDFSGLIGEFTAVTGSTTTRIPVVPEVQVRQLLANSPSSGIPRVAAVRPKSLGAGVQLYEVVLYPTPDDAISLDYRYSIVPGELSEASNRLYGGRQFAELILESCLAVAEARILKAAGAATERFRTRLAAAIQLDKQSMAATGNSVWPVDEVEYGTLDWLRREVSGYAGLGYNYRALTYEQAGKVDSVVQSGVMRVYSPPPLGESAKSHQWSFLTPVAQVVFTNGDAAYDLPADCTGIVGELTATTGDTTSRVPIIPEPHLRQMSAAAAATGIPRYAAVRPKSGGGYELLVYPTPNAAMTYEYRYTIVPETLSEANPRPYGGNQFSELFLESCLALAEDRILKTPGPAADRYLSRLTAAIQYDVQATNPTDTETWEVSDDETSLAVTKTYLRRIIGREFGYGANPATWTHRQQKDVHYALTTGLRQFYNPAVLPGERVPHKWSFLIPRVTLTTEEGVYAYDLPADFAMFDGPLIYAPDTQILYPPIEIIGEHQVQYRLQRNESAFRPQVAAVRVKSVEDSGVTVRELIVWPVPDGAYDITYRYRIDPEGLPDDTAVPHGGPAHAQTVVESCLAAVELIQKKPGTHMEMFAVRLASSVALDRDASTPERLGLSIDTSERMRFDRFGDYHDCDENIVTYNGQVW